jgi:multidrug resistance efflux pump
MTATLLTTSTRSSTVFRSLEAHVVPHLVQVDAGTDGIVSSVVAAHEVVERGQTVAVLERLSPRDDHDQQVAVTAPVPGVVIRCWAKAGDLVGRAWPILHIASRDDVVVVARFAAETVARLRRGSNAAVFLVAGKPEPRSATIMSVVEVADTGASEGAHASRSAAVVLSLPHAPVEALWPGSAAHVEVRC